MSVDLHAHSNRSDGSDEPADLVGKAAAKKLTAVALTDHDTLEGIDEARRAAETLSMELIPGVEISCEWAQGTMHVVVLFVESGPGPLQDRLAELQASRSQRNYKITDRLRRLGIDITMEEVIDESRVGVVGRPHFAAVLVRKGVVADIPTAFTDYLGNQAPAYVPRLRLEPEEAISLARASGGVPILSHPHTLGHTSANEFAATYRRLTAAGLVGIDAYYGDYTPDQREDLAATARSFGLIPSGGSDYHGSYKEGLELGSGRGDLDVPDSVLEELRSVHQKLVGAP
ncbi:MAG: PHP domain-containing protein [Acidimicrobiia bacterium]|nr:PHP domain-containing protein [Acidimicrobiia bacterium]